VIVLDASVVIAFLSAADVHHEEADALLADYANEGFTVHPLTLSEILLKGARVGRLNQLASDLRALGISQHVPDVDEPLILAELRATTALKLPDCCVLSSALQLSAPLATFDAQLARIATEHRVNVIAVEL
jgi:predicted nucleic acid-binding protein